jgi:ketosteroid isomerase-like protein
MEDGKMLKMARFFVCAVAIAVAFTSTASAQKSDVKGEIDKANAAFAAAFAKGDAAAIAKMYSADARVFAPNADVIQGAEGIQKLWKGAMDMGVKSVKLQATEVETHGAVVHEVGSYSMHAADGKQIDRGKYLVIWKREGNAWKLHRDIWNTSMPAPAAK